MLRETIPFVIFWIALLFVAYTYVGYPALLALVSRWASRPISRRPSEVSVSVIIAARNERTRLLAKLENLQELDYPPDRLQIILALDGCTDGSEEAVAPFARAGIEVVSLPEHRGKASALTAALARARGDVVVFADVRQQIDPGALRALTAAMADPSVGVVSGELVLTDETGAEARDAVGLYWRYEKKIRAWESQVHSVVGATGALYAVRRALIRTPPEGTLLDDVMIPMEAVLLGGRCVFEPAARVFDRASCCSASEYRRKVRTLAGNFQLLVLRPEFLNPFRNPIWLQFVSHKVARLLVPYALVALFLSNLFLPGPLYGVVLLSQTIFYVAALVGMMLEAKETGPVTVWDGPRRAS